MRRRLSRWHRRIGLTSLALLAWLAVTGVLLNHSTGLGLDRPIGTPLIARLYGIEADCAPAGWPLDGRLLIDCGRTLLLDGQVVPEARGPVSGALRWQDLLFIAGEHGLLLLTPQGDLVEALSPSLLPGQPLRLGHTPEHVVLRTPAGMFASNADLLQWRSLDEGAAVRWAQPQAVETDALRRARAHAAARRLSWTKLLQDLHSGRILGTVGSLLADLGAAAILVLAALGLIMSRRAERRRLRQAMARAPSARDGTPSA